MCAGRGAVPSAPPRRRRAKRRGQGKRAELAAKHAAQREALAQQMADMHHDFEKLAAAPEQVRRRGTRLITLTDSSAHD